MLRWVLHVDVDVAVDVAVDCDCNLKVGVDTGVLLGGCCSVSLLQGEHVAHDALSTQDQKGAPPADRGVVGPAQVPQAVE